MTVLSLKPLFGEILVKFTYLVGIIADQNFFDIFLMFFYPTASATAEGENCVYGPILVFDFLVILSCILKLVNTYFQDILSVLHVRTINKSHKR